MNRRLGTVRLVLMFALLVAVALAGCSQSTGGSGAPSAASSGTPGTYTTIQELSGAIQKRFAADQTVRVRFDSTVSQGGTVQSDTRGDGSIRVDSAGTAAQVAITQKGTSGESNLELVVLPDAAYIKLPEGQSPQPGKPWFKIDPNGSDPISKALGPALAQLQGTTDPLSSLTKSGTTTIAGSAADTVDGSPAVRYDLRVDLTQGATDPSAAEPFKTLGITTLEPKVWLDGQDRLQRFELIVNQPSGGVKIETSAGYRDWGQPVDITPPPADQVGGVPG